MRASFSIMNLPASAACQLVPQATMRTAVNSLNSSAEISISSRKIRPVSCPTRPSERVAHGARLLKDFLEHEVLVAALFRHDRIPQDVGDLALDRAPVEIGEVHAVAA